jgi:hypothetical protein
MPRKPTMTWLTNPANRSSAQKFIHRTPDIATTTSTTASTTKPLTNIRPQEQNRTHPFSIPASMTAEPILPSRYHTSTQNPPTNTTMPPKNVKQRGAAGNALSLFTSEENRPIVTAIGLFAVSCSVSFCRWGSKRVLSAGVRRVGCWMGATCGEAGKKKTKWPRGVLNLGLDMS